MNCNSEQSAKIALTYANDQHMDGAGAQLQRIYGIYALAKFLKLPYIHSPLKQIGYQGLAALEHNVAAPDLHETYNRTFSLPSDIEPPENPTVHTVKSVDLAALERLKNSGGDGKFQLVRILYPYAVTDKNPEIYRCLKSVSPFPKVRSEVFRIAIHVRRGEQIALSSTRLLPNSYFVACAMKTIEAVRRLGIPFVCELYTEVPSKAFVVTPRHHGILGRIPGNVTVDPGVNRLEEFEVIPQLLKFINIDPIETLRRLATADALVISRSSYSYLAALFNPSGIVVYHPFWHSPLEEWLVSDAHGMVDEERLIAQLESWRSSENQGNAADFKNQVDRLEGPA